MTIDPNEKSGIIEPDEHKIRMSQDTTRQIPLSVEKMMKRFSQVGSGLFYVIVLDGRPVMLFTSNKIEILDKFQS